MRRPLLLVPVTVLVVLAVAWLFDTRTHDGQALRNVHVAGTDVGGLDRSAIVEVVVGLADRYAESDVTIRTPDGDIKTAAGALGLHVEADDTVDRALDEGRDDILPLRPVRWVQSLLSRREAGVVVTVDRAKVRAVVAAEDPTDREDPVEPGITGDDGEIAVLAGESGTGIDADGVAAAIVEAAAGGELPITVDVTPRQLEPRFTSADAESLAERARGLTLSPITVTALETTADIAGSMLRSWLRSEPGDDGLELALDADSVLDDLGEVLDDAGTQSQDARFSIEDGKPVIVPGVHGTSCCAPDAVGFLLGALSSGTGGPVELPLEHAAPDQTTDELEKLEITEEIGSFTTRHNAGESRVTNIHRIADLVRGVVIEPGESFSVNSHVGKRTTENGFVVGGVIENGTFSESVGGGVSQFATTLFNATFFAGLDVDEYQSHSIYISRYPYGREATLSYPKPDLVTANSTPHGVLIWTSYTSTSITVTMYSTRWARGEQTNQTEAPIGEAGCKRVTTERTRTYIDGTTKVDRFFATYRPSEGVKC